jgi:pyridoxine 5'-phosphate synthase PdxJ
MNYSTLDTIVLNRDLPEYGLKIGDLGTIVEIYEPDGIEVEFVTASGRTGALLTLNVRDVRHVADADLVTVRQFARSA